MAVFKIRPAAVSTTYDNWTLGAGTSKVLAVDPGPAFTDDNAASYIASVAAPAVGPLSAVAQGFTLGTRPPIFSLTSLKIRGRGQPSGAIADPAALSCFFRLRGVDGSVFFLISIDNTTWKIGTTSEMINYRPGGTPGSTPFTVDDLNDPTLELVVYVQDWVSGAGQMVWLTTLWVEVAGVAVPTQSSQTRDSAGRFMNERRRRPAAMVALPGLPLNILDLEIGDLFSLSDPAMPATSGYGAGEKRWERSLLRLLDFTRVDMDNNKVDVLAVDLREMLTTFRDSGLATSPSQQADGVLRLDRGQTRGYTRSGLAWCEDADGIVREVPTDVEVLDRRGMMLERVSTNVLMGSSFRYASSSGGTFQNWTLSGTSGGGSFSIGSNALMGADVSTRALVMTTTGTITVALSALSDATTAAVVKRLSVDLVGNAGGSWGYRLVRGGDGFFWNDAAIAFTSTATDNAVVQSGALERYRSNIIAGTSADTYTVRLRYPTTASSSGVTTTFYHVQLETLPWASSRIVTDSAAVTRALPTLTISNNSGARAWEASGCGEVAFTPNWSSADVSGYGFVIFYARHDANNIMEVLYDGTTGLLWLYRRAAGVDYAATKAVTFVAGTRYIISHRAISSEGELGATAYTLSVFVDGVKGTDVTAAALVEQAAANMLIGSDGSSNCADGAVSLVNFRQQVYSDDEITREAAYLTASS